MRAWYKYVVTDRAEGSVYQPVSSVAEEYARSGGGFGVTGSYASKENFFKNYFSRDNVEYRRVVDYDSFISQQLGKHQTVLSVGSGRCVNELRLMERSFRITCSDLQTPECYAATKALFPDFKHIQLDILSSPAPAKYDAVLALSVMYLFDDAELARFFANVSESLHDGGHLILDSPGSPDNLLSRLVHDGVLKYEQKIRRSIRSGVKRVPSALAAEHCGYRRSNTDILKAARVSRFELVSYEAYDFLTEFERSIMLRNIIHRTSLTKTIFEGIGRMIPYVRMFDLVKA